MKAKLWGFILLFLSLTLYSEEITQKQQVSGVVDSISVGNKSCIWGLNGNQIYRWNKVNQWEMIPGSLCQISVGLDNTVCGINEKGEVYRWNGNDTSHENSWVRIEGSLKYIAVGNALNIWGIDREGNVLQHSNGQWINRKGSLQQIAVGQDGAVWGLNSLGEIFRRDNDEWTQIPGILQQISVSENTNVWGINAQGELLRWDGGISTQNKWTRIEGIYLKQVSISNWTAWGIEASGKICRFNCYKDISPLASKNHRNVVSPWTLKELEEVANKYTPYIYFSELDPFATSSVEWMLERCNLTRLEQEKETIVAVPPQTTKELAKINKATKGVRYYPTMENEIKKGSFENTAIYVHAKALKEHQTYTDIQYWFFYPFNGSGTLTIFGYIYPIALFGEHYGDWEHITLRIDNNTKEILAIYFSQHADGEWVFDLSKVEFKNGRPVIYSSKHGHASYYNVGKHTETIACVGLVNQTDQGYLLDTANKCRLISHWGDTTKTLEEFPWLDFAYGWGAPGPKYSKAVLKKYFPDLADWQIELVGPVLEIFWEKIVSGGPSGPKQKSSWDGPE